MSAAGAARLLAVGSAWRVTGAAAAGRRLVVAAATGAEDEQAVAGTLLVRGGDRAVPLVAEALRTPAASPVLVDVLASIGSPVARAELARLTSAPSRAVADAAGAALRTLRDADEHNGDQP